MVFKPRNNEDFRQALKYYFGETDTLPTDTTEHLIGRHDDITKITIGHWDTANVTDMSSAFDCSQPSQSGRKRFNEDISRWNTSSVTTFSAMFRQQREFNQPIGGWNTSKATNFDSMFHGAQSFNQPIGNWNTSSVTNMANMFQGAVKFNQYIGGWNVSNVTNFSHMFFIATSFNQYISNWNVRSGEQFQFMFAKATNFGYSIRKWSVTEGANLISMFVSASALHSLYSDTAEFADTPKIEFFNYVEPAKKVLYGYDMTFQSATVDQTTLAIGRHLHRNAHNSRNVNSGVQHIRTKRHTQAARATLSKDGVQHESARHDRNLVLSRLRRARG